MKCICRDWEENINLVAGPHTLGFSAIVKYAGKVFKYCPWCGNELIEEYVDYDDFSNVPDSYLNNQCTCGTDAFKQSTGGCPAHGVNEWGIINNENCGMI